MDGGALLGFQDIRSMAFPRGKARTCVLPTGTDGVGVESQSPIKSGGGIWVAIRDQKVVIATKQIGLLPVP